MRLPALAVLSVSLVSLSLAACASRPEEISAAYVSPLSYKTYSCQQLREEAQRVAARGAQAVGVQNEKARNDEIATAASVVVFWPAAFFIKGNGANAAEVASLKGEADAIEQASIEKRCGLDFRRG